MTGDLQQLDPAIRALLPAYLANRRNDIKSLAQLLANEQMDEIRRLGHNIKGSGGSYGLDDFTSVGNSIEQAALANDLPALSKLVKDLEECAANLARNLAS